jgi:hypothetical protein
MQLMEMPMVIVPHAFSKRTLVHSAQQHASAQHIGFQDF